MWTVFSLFLASTPYTLDTIQGLCIKSGMKVWINWISRNILSQNFKFVGSLNIIKELFHFFCLIARILLIQRHNFGKQQIFSAVAEAVFFLQKIIK